MHIKFLCIDYFQVFSFYTHVSLQKLHLFLIFRNLTTLASVVVVVVLRPR